MSRRPVKPVDVTGIVRRALKAPDSEWGEFLAAFERRLERLTAVQEGNATVVRYYRRGYTERARRKVRPHYVHRIVINDKEK